MYSTEEHHNSITACLKDILIVKNQQEKSTILDKKTHRKPKAHVQSSHSEADIAKSSPLMTRNETNVSSLKTSNLQSKNPPLFEKSHHSTNLRGESPFSHSYERDLDYLNVYDLPRMLRHGISPQYFVQQVFDRETNNIGSSYILPDFTIRNPLGLLSFVSAVTIAPFAAQYFHSISAAPYLRLALLQKSWFLGVGNPNDLNDIYEASKFHWLMQQTDFISPGGEKEGQNHIHSPSHYEYFHHSSSDEVNLCDEGQENGLGWTYVGILLNKMLNHDYWHRYHKFGNAQFEALYQEILRIHKELTFLKDKSKQCEIPKHLWTYFMLNGIILFSLGYNKLDTDHGLYNVDELIYPPLETSHDDDHVRVII